MGKTCNMHKIYEQDIPPEKSLCRSPGCRQEDNIKMGQREMEYECRCWFQLAQNVVQYQTFVNMVMEP